ncbi:MAG: UDP-N-acetylglucosamine 1-carboxyvinyltransferase [Pseudanabaenaceae cyanobacterium]
MNITAVPLATENSDTALHIRGGATLGGQVRISGAKNSALALLAGSLLTADTSTLRNVPNLVDIHCMSAILEALGARVQAKGDILQIDASNVGLASPPYELVSKMRASFFVIGSLLGRFGQAKVPLPGGCAIGVRPVDLHVRGLQALGAEVHMEHGLVSAYCGQGRRLQGAQIYLDYPSVGATETIMMAATLAKGQTVIENSAQEPEVVDLAGFCNAMGARIQGAGTKTITIEGVEALHGTDYTIIPDRIETGTFLVAGAITRSRIMLAPVVPEHSVAVIAKLQEIGVQVNQVGSDRLEVIGTDQMSATDIETLPFPGFPTDMQAQFMALLTLCTGNSVITETVFENRMHHVPELQRMGANIKLKGNVAVVSGVPMLSGAPVMATDLRASAALVLAGLAAQGTTIVKGLHHLDRGYERLEEKLRQLGAQIERVQLC